MTDVPEIGGYRRDPHAKTWDVRVDEGTYLQCKSQFRAEVLGRMVKIEIAIKGIEKILNIKPDVDEDDIEQAREKLRSIGDEEDDHFPSH